MSFRTKKLRPWLLRQMCLLLSIIIAIPNTYATELPNHTPQFPGQSFEGVNYFPKLSARDEQEWSEHLQSELQISEPTNLETVASSGEDLVQLMLSYKDLFADSLRKIDAEIAVVGREYFLKERLDAAQVKFKHPSLGEIEFTNIDGHPVGKIVHQKSGVSFLIFDEDRVPRTSKHLQQYIARQHYDAGSTRADNKYIDENGDKQKIRPGRDVILMSIKMAGDDAPATLINNVEVAPRKKSLKQWWTATYKHPTKKDVLQGFTSGIVQFASVYALANLVSWILPGYVPKDAPLLAASFTLGYGTMLGVWNSFYQNWRSRGGKWKRYLKEIAVSLSYYFGIYVITSAGLQQITLHDLSIDPSQVVGFIDSFREGAKNPVLLAAMLHPFSNFLANLEFKNVSFYMQRIPEVERKDLGNLTIKIPKSISRNEETGKLQVDFASIKTPVSQRFWNRQFLYYLPVNWTKFLDQVWFTTTIGPAITGEYPIWVPLLSVVGFWSIVFSSVKGMNWWAYKKHTAAAEKLKIREGTSYYFLDFYKEKWNQVKEIGHKCAELLEGGPRYAKRIDL